MAGYLTGISPSLRELVTPTVDNFAAGVGFTAGSSTSVTLSSAPGDENRVIVTMDGVTQHHNTFSVSGTTLTFDTAIPSGVANIEARYAQENPNYTTVADNAISNAKMADDAVGLAELSASGTASSSTFLRGDNAWAAVTNPSITFVSSATASSSSSVEFTGLDNSAECWIIRWNNVHMSSTNNIAIRTSDDASSHSYESGASDYSWVCTGGYPYAAVTSIAHFDSADTMIKVGHDPTYPSTNNSDATNGYMYIWNPSETTYYKHITGMSSNGYDGGTAYNSYQDFQGVRRSTNAVTAVQIINAGGGTIDAGTFRLYKWLHS